MRLTYTMADQSFAAAKSLGIFSISLGLLRALSDAPAVEALAVLVNSSLPPVPGGAKIRTVTDDLALHVPLGRLWWDNVGVYRAARRAGHEWLFLPKGYASILGACPVGLAVYMHDIMSVIYRERYPGSMGWVRHQYLVRTYVETLRHADVVFTNTEFTRGEIRRWAGEQRVACPPIVVAGYGFEPGGARRPKQDQVLVNIRSAPHKRTDLALAYVERWRRATRYPGRILCVGSLPAGAALPDPRSWSCAGRVTPVETLALMAESRALVHFTEYEGFGMPPVEAALARTPPVYSEIPVAREVMEGTGCPFDNASYAGFAQAMDKALAASETEVEDWAQHLARRHNWSAVRDRVVAGLAGAGPA